MNIRERRRDKKCTQPGKERRAKRNAGCYSTVHLPHAHALVVAHPEAVTRVYCAVKFRGAKFHRYGKGRPNDYGGGIIDHFHFTSVLGRRHVRAASTPHEVHRWPRAAAPSLVAMRPRAAEGKVVPPLGAA